MTTAAAQPDALVGRLPSAAVEGPEPIGNILPRVLADLHARAVAAAYLSSDRPDDSPATGDAGPTETEGGGR